MSIQAVLTATEPTGKSTTGRSGLGLGTGGIALRRYNRWATMWSKASWLKTVSVRT
ncbi:hypothetical protein D3C83_151840 [compost metagenome]